MGEDVGQNPSLFEIPAGQAVTLPPLEQIDFGTIPRSVLQRLDFEFHSQDIVNSQLLHEPAEMNFGPAGKAYVFPYSVRRRHGEWADNFHSVFEVDLGPDETIVGSGSSLIDLDVAGRESTRPYVWHTYTEPDYLRHGLGVRRYIVLNEANKRFFKDVLGSGALINREPVSLWEQLVASGLAVKEGDGFRFKEP